jgi:hypothetical protein
MRVKLVWLVAAIAVTFASSPGPARAGGILDLIPAATPAFVLIKNPARAEIDLQALFPASSKDATPPFAGLLPRLLGFEGTLEGIDENGPLVIAMPQFPFPLFATAVQDYDRFLSSLRGSGADDNSNQSLRSPVPGVDMAMVSGKPLFLRKEGGIALLSPMPVMLTPPAPGAGLTGVLSSEERASLAGSDIFVRLDVGTILTLAEPLITSYLTSLEKSFEDAPGKDTPPAEGNPQDTEKVLKAETDLFIAGLKQIASLSLGAAVSEGGLLFSSVTMPLPGSAFQQILGKMTPGTHEMLGYFDQGAVWSGAFSLDPTAFSVMVPAMVDFMKNSGIYNLTAADVEQWKNLVATALDVSGEESAVSFGSSRTGGAFSTLVLGNVRDSAKARGMMKDSFVFAEKILVSSPSDPEFRLGVQLDVETYEGVPIDGFTISLLPPGDEKERREFDAVMESMFGGNSLGVWIAFVENIMVASYYSPTSDDLKDLIDRVRRGKHGDLTGSAAFRSATGALPAQSLSLNYFSFPRFVSLIGGMMEKALPGKALPPWPLKDEDLSGIGITCSNPGGSLRVDTFLPSKEAQNIRVLLDYLKSLEPQGKKATPL